MLGDYDEHSAVPLMVEKHQQLVVYLWAQAEAATMILDTVQFSRDLLCSQYMWASAQRGHDVGKLGLADFVDPADIRRPLGGFPLLAPALWPAGRGTPVHRISQLSFGGGYVSALPYFRTA